MDIEVVALRIHRAAGPVRAAHFRGQLQRPQRTLETAGDGRREDRSHLVTLHHLERLSLEFGREIHQVVFGDALPIEWRGPVGIGCVGLLCSFGTSDCGTGRSSIGQIG